MISRKPLSIQGPQVSSLAILLTFKIDLVGVSSNIGLRSGECVLIAGMLSTTIFKWLKDGISKVGNPEKAPFESMKFLIST